MLYSSSLMIKTLCSARKLSYRPVSNDCHSDFSYTVEPLTPVAEIDSETGVALLHNLYINIVLTRFL